MLSDQALGGAEGANRRMLAVVGEALARLGAWAFGRVRSPLMAMKLGQS